MKLHATQRCSEECDDDGVAPTTAMMVMMTMQFTNNLAQNFRSDNGMNGIGNAIKILPMVSMAGFHFDLFEQSNLT